MSFWVLFLGLLRKSVGFTSLLSMMAIYRGAGRPAVRGRSVGFKNVVRRQTAKDVELQLARKVKTLERQMKARAPEEKFVDVSLSFINVASGSGAVGHLTIIAAGSDFNQRIGDTVRIHRITGHLRLATGAGSLGATLSGEEFVSSSIVVDGQQVGDTSPTASAVFADANPPSVLLNEAVSHKRFKILSTSPLLEAARVGPNSVIGVVTYAQAPTQSAVWYYDFPCAIRTSFNGTATTDIEKNGIYMVVRSSIAAASADLDGRCRLYYTDC